MLGNVCFRNGNCLLVLMPVNPTQREIIPNTARVAIVLFVYGMMKGRARDGREMDNVRETNALIVSGMTSLLRG